MVKATQTKTNILYLFWYDFKTGHKDFLPRHKCTEMSQKGEVYNVRISLSILIYVSHNIRKYLIREYLI